MKRGVVLLIAILSATGLVGAIASQETVQLSDEQRKVLQGEANRLWDEAHRQEKEEKFAEAARFGQQGLAVERQIFGNVHEEIVGSQLQLARWFELQEHFDAARKSRHEILQVLTQLHGAKHWRVTDARLALANVQSLAALSPAQRGKLKEASSLLEKAKQLIWEGKQPQAIPLTEQARSLRLTFRGNQHLEVAETEIWLGRCYADQGDNTRAEPHYRKSQEIRERILGPAHPEVAVCLHNLAQLYREQAKYALAEPLYERAIEIREQTIGKDHALVAISKSGLASVCKHRGEYQRAEQLYRQALEINKQALGEDQPDYAHNLNDLAVLYDMLENYTAAEPLYRQASAIYKRAAGETHPFYATSLSNIADLLRSKGDYAQAEELCRQAIAIWRQIQKESHPQYANALVILAGIHKGQGDFARAEPLFLQGLEIRRRVFGPAHPDVASSLDNLGRLYDVQQAYARAEPLFRESVEIRKAVLGEKHPHYALSLNNLGMFYVSQGQYAQGEQIHQQALRIRAQTLGKDSHDYAQSLYNLALIAYLQRDFTRAESLFRQVFRVQENSPLGREADLAAAHNHLGTIERLQGDAESAESDYRQALAFSFAALERASDGQSERQQIAMTSRHFECLEYYLSLAAQNQQFHRSAYEQVLAWKGIVGRRQMAMRAAADNPELAPQLAELAAVARELSRLALAAPAAAERQTWQSQIGELSERKEQLEANLAKQSAAYRAASRPVTLADLEQALGDEVLVDYVDYWYRRPDPAADAGGTWEEHLAAFIVRRGGSVKFLDLGLVKALNEAAADWREGHGWTDASRAAGQRLRQACWEPIERHLAGAAHVLVALDGPLRMVPLGALPGRTPGTYLIEDCPLGVIPNPHALISSATRNGKHEATNKSNAPGGIEQLLGLGGVDYDADLAAPTAQPGAPASAQVRSRQRPTDRSGDGSRFSFLPGTRGELNAIGSLHRQHFEMGEATVLEAGRATEEAFRREAPRHRYLHIATHGYFAPPSVKSALSRNARNVERLGGLLNEQSLAGYHPNLLSGIALAGANRPLSEGDDGILTAEEIQALDLRNVDLVVLSACETGLGEQHAGGEGLLGLQRAFQVAGATTVVASLWSVPDQATRALMVRFYENLWNTNKQLGKLEALREAQLWMLKHGAEQPEIRRELVARGLKEYVGDREQGTGDRRRLPPYYWAAWVLSGDWREGR